MHCDKARSLIVTKVHRIPLGLDLICLVIACIVAKPEVCLWSQSVSDLVALEK